MIYHQFVTIRTLNQSMLWFPTHINNIGVILYKQMCTPNGSPFLLTYLGYKMTYEPTFHICDL